ncbi:MAG TPA: universal stress protein [Spongiibacteraceae bacterium]|nr:universal stress protein [Spongiibacteraceae bacterium]
MYKRIFCPIDGSEPSLHCMREAIRLAKDQKAELCFFHIVDNSTLIMYMPIVESVFETMRQEGRNILESAVAAARAQDVQAEQKILEIMTGRAGPLIVEEAEKYGADLIAIGTHGRRGISRLLMGSDAAAVIGASKVPVLLVK